jgi:hypothetical protein
VGAMAVNKVEAFGETLIDLTGDTVTPETLAQGATAHNAAGESITGVMPASGGTSNILQVTTTASLSSEMGGVLYNTSHSFSEIKNAYNNGYFIFIIIDISQISANTFISIPLTIIDFANNFASFSTVVDLGGTPAYVGCYVFESESLNNFMIRPIAA